jgi:putative endonuclease
MRAAQSQGGAMPAEGRFRFAPVRHIKVGMIRGLLTRIATGARRLAGNIEEGGRQALGRRGERDAERYLKRRGYRILARNFRAAGAEIDLVAAEGGTLVFVEVKARRGLSTGTPQEAVDDRKQRRIRRAAEIYVARARAHDCPVRFDVVAIRMDGERAQIELLKDAF